MTGSARGIGLGIARRLALEGASVAMLDIDGPLAAEVAETLAVRGAWVLAYPSDVADRVAVKRTVALVLERFGRIDVKAPRVRDHSGSGIRFSSNILPRNLRLTQSIEDLLTWLYLKGISSWDFSMRLAALLWVGATFGPVKPVQKRFLGYKQH